MIGKVAIADDDSSARNQVRSVLEEATAGSCELLECKSGLETLRILRAGIADIVFLDVQMAELGGLDALYALGRAHRLPAMIFVTRSRRHAVAAFELNVVDYLLKPVDALRLRESFTRARLRAENTQLSMLQSDFARVVGLMERARQPLTHVMMQKHERLEVVAISDIDWIESEGNYVRVHFGHSSHLVRGTIASIQDRLAHSGLVQVHRKYAVSLGKVLEVRRMFKDEYLIILRGGAEIPVSRRFRRQLPILR